MAAEILPAEVVPTEDGRDRGAPVEAGDARSSDQLDAIRARPEREQARSRGAEDPGRAAHAGRETRMHVTVSPEFVALLKKAKAGQSHVQPGATDEQVLTAALELLIAQQEKRRAVVPPKVKREVRKRDGGKCTWPLGEWRHVRLGIRTEIDHVVPRGRGGPSTVENCRVLCDVHNRGSRAPGLRRRAHGPVRSAPTSGLRTGRADMVHARRASAD